MPNKIQMYRISSGAISALGAAEAYSIPVRGRILSVHVDYPTNTCTIDLDTDEAVSQKIVDLAAANTDAVYYPRTPVCSNAGAENVYFEGTNKVHTEFVVFGRIKLTIASGTADEIVNVSILVEEW